MHFSQGLSGDWQIPSSQRTNKRRISCAAVDGPDLPCWWTIRAGSTQKASRPFAACHCATVYSE